MFCEQPENVTNGFYDPLADDYEVFENVTYFCDEGYELKGFPGPYNCTEDGTFDIEEYPTCEGACGFLYQTHLEA